MNNSADNMKLLFFLSQFDFLSQKPTLLINNSERIRSFPGALLTLTVWILTITMTVLIFQNFYMNGVPTVVKSSLEYNSDYKSFDISSLPFMFSFVNKSNGVPIDISYFKLNMTLLTSERTDRASNLNMINQTKLTELNLSYCKQSENLNNAFPQYSWLNTVFLSYYCLEASQPISITFHDFNRKPNSYYYSELNLQLMCYNCSKAFINSIDFSIIMFSDMLDLKDTYNISQKSVIVENFPLISESALNVDIQIKQGTVFTDVGLLNVIKKSLDYIKFKLKRLIYLPQDNNSELLSSVRISQESIQENYYRHYTKLPLLFAQIGGIYYIIYMVANNINIIYSVVHFYLSIDNNTKVSYFLQKEEISRRKARLAAITNSVGNLRNINIESLLVHNHQQKSEDLGMLLIRDNPHKRINYTNEIIDSVMNEFKIKVRSVGRPISSTVDIFKRIICCDNKSEETKLYNKTVIRIREFLDVNNIIKLMIEFQFLKSIIFSKNVQKLFKFFSDVNLVNSEKLTEIQILLKDIYNKHEGEEGYLLDQYAAQFFIENYMKN